jgi:predicted Zn-ribbon and HTH transcriptional regulator
MMKTASLPKCSAFSIDNDDMHFTIECPHCLAETEYEGLFDSTDVTRCPKCDMDFIANRLIMNDGIIS